MSSCSTDEFHEKFKNKDYKVYQSLLMSDQNMASSQQDHHLLPPTLWNVHPSPSGSPTQLQDQDLQPQEAAGYSAGIPLDPCSRNLAESATCSWSCSCWLQRRGGAESSWSLGVMGMVDVGCPTLWEPKDGQSDETMSNWVRVPPV